MTDTVNHSATSLRDDHIQKTVNQRREANTINMEIISVANASPTVKHLVLHTTVKPIPISFKAGQWVDMFIPGVDTVGGFSICSSPIHLSRTGEMSLCVKHSDHPPANWVRNKCKPGSTVSIRVGGDFFLDTNDNSTTGKKVLLVGGGVGINPLLSIIAQLQDYRKTVVSSTLKSCLMYSAKTKAELLFKEIAKLLERKLSDSFLIGKTFQDSLNKFALDDQTFTVQYFITGDEENVELKGSVICEEDSVFKYGRITKLDIERCLLSNLNLQIGSEEANMETVVVYVCGPPPMIQHVQDICKSLGMQNVFYEKWW